MSLLIYNSINALILDDVTFVSVKVNYQALILHAHWWCTHTEGVRTEGPVEPMIRGF